MKSANMVIHTDAMGDDKLCVIVHELLMSLRENVSVDWARRDSARARMRVPVKRILRKYGYPPNLQDVAVQTVCSKPGRYRRSGVLLMNNQYARQMVFTERVSARSSAVR
ncbi:MAG: DUF3387 domain-containing protein [Azoarcus sp.]|jgi:hypothetical protein|nr:DUF3387 domain-containing protein [Azoarcus sp.]